MKVEGVILAAGMSSRAGGFKPSFDLGGKTMIGRCVDGMQEVCERIIVVGGREFERLQALVEGYPNVACVKNPSYHIGMFTSVKAGLARVTADRCFVLPADIPLVPGAVYRKLLSLNAEAVIPSYRGRNGHPVCLSGNAIPFILLQPDESSLRETLRLLNSQTVDVGAEEVLVDIDTPEDYKSASLRIARSMKPSSLN